MSSWRPLQAAIWWRGPSGGEEAAFTALFDAYKRRVYGLCLRMTGSPEEASLRVFRKISTFRGESVFSTWLQWLAVNVILSHLRKKRLQETPLEQAHQTCS